MAYVNFDGAQALVAARAVPRDRPLDDGFLEATYPSALEAVRALVRGFEGEPDHLTDG